MNTNKNGDVNLTYDELNALLDKEIGHGTDGRVISFDRNRLIKLYHKYVRYYKNKKQAIATEDDTDMKIYHKGDYKKVDDTFDMFRFYEKEENGEFIRIRNGEAAIKSAQERQMKVTNTRLPQNSVYIDGKFAGCTLLTIRGIQMHKLIGLPFALKRKIMKKVLYNVKELMDNYIYHIDLDNSPFTKNSCYTNDEGKTELVGHSHVIINPVTLKPQLIDLDGKSTVYTDSYSKKLEHQSLASFNRLMIEFMLGIDLDEYKDEEDLSYILEKIGIDIEYIDMLVSNSMTYEDLNNFLDSTHGIERI